MLDLADIKQKFDRIRIAASSHDNRLVKMILRDFNKCYRLKDLPQPILYDRLFFGAGSSETTDERIASLREIESNLSLFDKYPEQKFSLLLQAGRLESGIRKKGISVKYYSDALGLAEAIQNNILIAEAYMNIGQMFSSRPGLGLYFYRKAEIKYTESDDKNAAAKVRLERAFLTTVCRRTCIIEDKRNDLLREANNLIEGDNYVPPNLHEKIWT